MNAVPLPTQRATAGFYARTTLDESPASARAVSLAVARGKEGDSDAIRYLYVRYSHNIYGYVRSIVRDEHEAEDVTQHVFAKLITTIGKYDDRGVPFFAWLLRLARNVAIDHLRAKRTEPLDPETIGEAERAMWVASAGANIDQDIATADLRDELAQLPLDQRRALLLAALFGFTAREIGEIEQIPLGTAKTRIRTAMLKLGKDAENDDTASPEAEEGDAS